ncbi:sensor histidine kinase [Amnibacterium sp.]|uniref:sensor histidine kinase n=1 Tax=Amnibacterium sp. TaxID=1872496 RepID=UPI003F7B9A6B
MTRPAAAGPHGPSAAAALTVASLLVVVVAIAVGAHGDPARGIAFGLLGCGSALAVGLLGRRAPGPAAALSGAASMSAFVLQPLPPVALLPFAIGVALAMRAGAIVWAISSVVAAYAVSITTVFLSPNPVDSARGFGAMALLLVAIGAGAFLRARRARRQDEQRRQAERQRAAIEEERLRIARELHDVLAHSLSSISVQAGVGLHLAGDRPEAATEALETIRTASREALQEVRGVLGVLRGDESAPRTPGPDLAALRALVEDTRRTGARVDLEDRLDPRPSTAVQLAMYRVVQEALTNARRHAPGAAVEIALGRDGGTVTATVRDRMPGARPRPPAAGNGIVGMRERAAALGGSLDLVPHEDGLEVVLRIPVPEGSP